MVILYGYQSFILLLSNDVKCFGEDSCYSLAFGTAAIIMVIAGIVLILGKTHYIKNTPVGSIMTQVIGIIWVKITFYYLSIKYL
jgi:solute carrier family 15 oligopeptide transporter 1